MTAIQDQLDSYLEAASFCLVEPVYLGFYPFQTEETSNSNERMCNTPGEVTTDGSNNDNQDRRNAPSSNGEGGIGDGILEGENTVVEVERGRLEENNDIVEVEYASTEVPTVSQANSDDEVRRCVQQLSKESVSLHRKISKALMSVSTC